MQSWYCFSEGLGRNMNYRSAAFDWAKCKRTLQLNTFHIKLTAVIEVAVFKIDTNRSL